MAKVKHQGRTTEVEESPNSDLAAIFDEAEKRAAERDGFRLVIGDRTFELWPSRLTHHEKLRIHKRTGMTVEGGLSNLDTAPMEAMVTIIVASIRQTTDTWPDPNGVSHWLSQTLNDSGDELTVDWETLSHDEAVTADPLEHGEPS